MRTIETATIQIATIVHDSSVERDDEAFFDLDNNEILDALTDFRDDEDDVADFMGWLGFDRNDWTTDPQ